VLERWIMFHGLVFPRQSGTGVSCSRRDEAYGWHYFQRVDPKLMRQLSRVDPLLRDRGRSAEQDGAIDLAGFISSHGFLRSS